MRTPSGKVLVALATAFFGGVSYTVYSENKATKDRQVAGMLADQERHKKKVESRAQQEENKRYQEEMLVLDQKMRAQREEELAQGVQK